MSAEFIFLLVLLTIMACVAIWFTYQKKLKNSLWHKSEADPFLQKIISDKAHIDEIIVNSIQQHEIGLEKRFDSDMKQLKLKEELSQFAHINKLDEALITLWDEIKHYPEWLGKEDLDNWNKLNLKAIVNTSEENTSSVGFLYKGQHFSVKEKTEYDATKLNANLSFFEDDNEVFSIDCLINSEGEKTSYVCQHIISFKKRGNWPKVLLECYGQLKIEKEKYLNEIKYFRANEIKSRFGE